jgi:hypothetical protein
MAGQMAKAHFGLQPVHQYGSSRVAGTADDVAWVMNVEAASKSKLHRPAPAAVLRLAAVLVPWHWQALKFKPHGNAPS